MNQLQQGSQGIQVEYLQRLLNKAATRDRAVGAPLRVDGAFGPLTASAVSAFQARHRPLRVSGMVDTSTWQALGLRRECEHRNVIQYGQPTGTTCWSAAATIILGNRSVGQGEAALAPNGGLAPSMDNVRAFGRSLGWTMPNCSPTPTALAEIVCRTPVWIAAGGNNWGHAVALTGVYSDEDNRGDGIMFRIHDPWPPGRGRIYGAFSNPLTMFDASGVNRVEANLMFILLPH